LKEEKTGNKISVYRDSCSVDHLLAAFDEKTSAGFARFNADFTEAFSGDAPRVFPPATGRLLFFPLDGKMTAKADA